METDKQAATIFIRVRPKDWKLYFTSTKAMRVKIRDITAGRPLVNKVFFFHQNGDNFAAVKVGGRWSRQVHGVLRTSSERTKHRDTYNCMFNGSL